MQKLKNAASYLEGKLLSFLGMQAPYLHTAWQAAFGALFAGLVTVKSSADVKATVMVAVATFLAALKAAYLNSRG